jgi:hypothetical protein
MPRDRYAPLPPDLEAAVRDCLKITPADPGAAAWQQIAGCVLATMDERVEAVREQIAVRLDAWAEDWNRLLPTLPDHTLIAPYVLWRAAELVRECSDFLAAPAPAPPAEKENK